MTTIPQISPEENIGITHEIRKQSGVLRAKVTHLITYELRIRGWTQARLAADLGITAGAISRVVNGAGHSSQILDKLREIGISENLLHDPRLPLTNKQYTDRRPGPKPRG